MTAPANITDWVKPGDTTGEYRRQTSTFRNSISRAAGAEFPPAKNRYHLYVSYACPWAHRTLIARKLKGLQDVISFTVVHWHLGSGGWRFFEEGEEGGGEEGAGPDPMPGHGRNESAEILRMFGTEFDDLIAEEYRSVVLVPDTLRTQIDDTNSWTYDLINNGVYKSGFATTAEAYETHVVALFKALDRAEAQLVSVRSEGPYYFGRVLTEADIRLYVTLVRFDVVYVQHFKCNLCDIRSGYPALHRWLRNLYWKHEAFKTTTQFQHIKWHYTRSHTQINPVSITPLGPVPDLLPCDEEVAAVRAARGDEGF
ncbi:glutathione S-transferase [Ophiocordyceps camponoti-floridani]|uniref:Glutathione S-transferase n=1 Tax=Ophiocordyceps camponoti-floridani TaxID=2030778 RepID=A0A8H4Q7K5_9HYPO|nr:glutathione S-transferase [Ophiocordyceps camponoti-floridani]